LFYHLSEQMLNLAKMYTHYFPGLFCLMQVELEDGILQQCDSIMEANRKCEAGCALNAV